MWLRGRWMLLFFTPAEQQCKWLVQSMPRHMKDTKLILVNIISFVLLFDYHYPVFIYSANTFQVHHQSWCNNLVVSLNTQINFSASPSNVATSAVVIHMTTRRIKFFFFFWQKTRHSWLLMIYVCKPDKRTLESMFLLSKGPITSYNPQTGG